MFVMLSVVTHGLKLVHIFICMCEINVIILSLTYILRARGAQYINFDLRDGTEITASIQLCQEDGQ